MGLRFRGFRVGLVSRVRGFGVKGLGLGSFYGVGGVWLQESQGCRPQSPNPITLNPKPEVSQG